MGAYFLRRRSDSFFCGLGAIFIADCAAHGRPGYAAREPALAEDWIRGIALARPRAGRGQLSTLEWLPPVRPLAQERRRLETRLDQRRMGIALLHGIGRCASAATGTSRSSR